MQSAVCVQGNQQCVQCNQLCVVSAMGDGNCSLRWSAAVSAVQESSCGERVTSDGEWA